MQKLPQDIKRTAISIVKGYEARKRRYSNTHMEFDRQALAAVEQALVSVGEDVQSEDVREIIKRKVFDSSMYNIRYEYIGEVYCGKNKFYDYRSDFIRKVAENLKMIEQGS